MLKSPKIVNKKAMIFSNSLMLGSVDIFFSILIIFAFDNLIISLYTICVILFIASPILINFSIKEEKEICYFLLTNRNLHVFQQGKSPLSFKNIHSHPLNSFRGIVFRKRFFDKNFDSGTIEFVTDELVPKKISIKNVPNMPFLQNIVESIYYFYGNVEEKWKKISNETNFQLPQIYEISSIKLKQLKKLKLIYVITLILDPIFCYLLIYIISLFISDLIVPVLTYLCGVAYATLILIQIFCMVKRTSYKNNQLVFSENEFLLKKKKTSYKISLNKEIAFDFKSSKGPLTSHKNILDNYDFIKISKSYNSQKNIKFGPFVKLPYILSFFFSYILIWKAKHGYLLSKEEIFKLNNS
ncbi:MAG: hypothetical protein ACFFDH_05470 [Promethearchaeota archaeon]